MSLSLPPAANPPVSKYSPACVAIVRIVIVIVTRSVLAGAFSVLFIFLFLEKLRVKRSAGIAFFQSLIAKIV